MRKYIMIGTKVVTRHGEAKVTGIELTAYRRTRCLSRTRTDACSIWITAIGHMAIKWRCDNVYEDGTQC